ncbi:MAG: redoxin domain-containing protein [Candidatus Magasanikbacteria bacterium]|jgi:NADH-dependent peroxiredoxin subunit C|nr:redoxin domain-containing protein [Candidatus Magasanikbacteria bacterium]MBT4071906.1 redoxin domain-containing protein [Candidatus Magasanikbacteria bacterium]
MEETTRIPQTIINTQLPDMSLEIYQDNNIKRVNLSDYKGKWLILFFYPADFTFVCPTELVEVADMYDKFKELDVEIMSVSTDTAFVHKAWHDNSPSIAKVNYPMAADPTGRLCRALGTYIEEEGLSYRATIIVDPEGKIKTYEIHDNSIGRSAEEMMRKIQAAQFVETHGGQVCPASWKPGKETLTPGVDLIGKI